jgi:hypothetical protein
MSTQSQTKLETLSTNVGQLPFLKHFDSTDIQKAANHFKSGEKPIYNIVKLLIFGALIYGFVAYALPFIMVTLGKIIATAIAGVIILIGFLSRQGILTWCRNIARKIHKLAIENDPFGQLERERVKLANKKTELSQSKGVIAKLRTDMENEAQRAEAEAKDGQTTILKLNGKAEKLKFKLTEMEKTHGQAIKGEDEYVNTQAELLKVVSDGNRTAAKLNQSKEFVLKYGSRANVIKKFLQKLNLAEVSMEIKIADFDTTVDMLKKDYAFASKAKQATNAAKSAMLFTKTWEVEYAMDIVQNTIAADIALTSANIKDINSLTSGYDLDSDDLYTNLDNLANSIKLGNETIPEAKKFNNVDYKLSQDEQTKSGGFSNLFD